MMLRTVLSAFALIAITACGVAAEQSQPAPAPQATPAAAAPAQPAPNTTPAAEPDATQLPEAATPEAATQEEEIKFFDRGRLPRCPGDPRCPRGDSGVAPRGNQAPGEGGSTGGG
jgi:hypothetical protein